MYHIYNYFNLDFGLFCQKNEQTQNLSYHYGEINFFNNEEEEFHIKYASSSRIYKLKYNKKLDNHSLFHYVPGCIQSVAKLNDKVKKRRVALKSFKATRQLLFNLQILKFKDERSYLLIRSKKNVGFVADDSYLKLYNKSRFYLCDLDYIRSRINLQNLKIRLFPLEGFTLLKKKKLYLMGTLFKESYYEYDKDGSIYEFKDIVSENSLNQEFDFILNNSEEQKFLNNFGFLMKKVTRDINNKEVVYMFREFYLSFMFYSNYVDYFNGFNLIKNFDKKLIFLKYILKWSFYFLSNFKNEEELILYYKKLSLLNIRN